MGGYQNLAENFLPFTHTAVHSPSINKQRIASHLAIRSSHATTCRLFINMYQRLIKSGESS